MSADPRVDPPTDPLTDAARRVLHATRRARLDDPGRARATALLAEAADLLEAHPDSGPLCQIGILTEEAGTDRARPRFDDPSGAMAGDGPRLGIDFAQLFPFSPVVGARHPFAPPVRLVVAEDGTIDGEVTLGDAYNGPPWDLAHGGVIALIFDELLAAAPIVAAGGGFTGRLTIHYRKPTPLHEPLRLRSWMERASGRKLLAKGTIEVAATGLLTAEAEGLFITSGAALSDTTPT